MEYGYNDSKDWNAFSTNQKKEIEDKDMKNNLALALIQSTIFEGLFLQIFACTLAQEAWKVLQENY